MNQLNFDKVFVLDTNIILEDASQFISISEGGKNLIVLPETVIDEVDTKKSGFEEINFQAREFGRFLSEAETINTEITADFTIVSLEVSGVRLEIVSLASYDVENADKSIVNDRKIIEVAKFAENYYKKPFKFLTNDIMCRTRAISAGLKAEGLFHDKESMSLEFIKTLENVDNQTLMSYKNIKDIDPDHKPENYCYLFKLLNGATRLGYVINEQLHLISDRDYDDLPVYPKNMGQKFAMSGMLNTDVNICVVEALAGSGKTLLALSAGMKKVKDGDYSKIIYIRNSVGAAEKAEEVGFLSGNDEKFAQFKHPLDDTLEFIAQRSIKKKENEFETESIKSKVKELLQTYNIEFFWNGSARGRTISNAYVIVDEVQNFSKTSLRTVLTRMDESCKVVCIGSNRQIDHPFVNKYTNGLNVLLKSMKEKTDDVVLFGTELNKVVRGKITEFAERIFE